MSALCIWILSAIITVVGVCCIVWVYTRKPRNTYESGGEVGPDSPANEPEDDKVTEEKITLWGVDTKYRIRLVDGGSFIKTFKSRLCESRYCVGSYQTKHRIVNGDVEASGIFNDRPNHYGLPPTRDIVADNKDRYKIEDIQKMEFEDYADVEYVITRLIGKKGSTVKSYTRDGEEVNE